MNVRPYKLYGESELNFARESIADAFERWRRQWLLPDMSASVVDVSPCSYSERKARHHASGLLKAESDERWCFFNLDPGRIRQIGAPLLGANPLDLQMVEGTITNDLALEALGALAKELSGGISNERHEEPVASSLPALASAPGSGCLMATFVIGRDQIACVLSPSAAEAHLRTSPESETKMERAGRLTPLTEAIGGQSVRLRARLSVADLALEPVITLQQGDVIQLDERLTDPLTLICDTSRLNCVGYLGVSDGKRSIRVAPADPGSGN